MENENKALNDEELTQATGGTGSRDSGLWTYMMESVYVPQIEAILNKATYSDDRSHIDNLLDTIKCRFMTYIPALDQILTVRLYQRTQSDKYKDPQIKAEFLSVLDSIIEFARRY